MPERNMARSKLGRGRLGVRFGKSNLISPGRTVKVHGGERKVKNRMLNFKKISRFPEQSEMTMVPSSPDPLTPFYLIESHFCRAY
jgi:hypothetical protein